MGLIGNLFKKLSPSPTPDQNNERALVPYNAAQQPQQANQQSTAGRAESQLGNVAVFQALKNLAEDSMKSPEPRHTNFGEEDLALQSRRWKRTMHIDPTHRFPQLFHKSNKIVSWTRDLAQVSTRLPPQAQWPPPPTLAVS
uniref:Uncharacterized protein n=1 Tax=Ditylenchus dipsaci TaxID=166011 RepID=A0A915E738_9BILA